MPPVTIAGRYRVLRPVGRGGMGTVWLCEDEVLGRQVAVKQIGRLGEAAGEEPAADRARALREARSAAALNHRNVVSVFDVVEDGGETWLVMEYLPSRSLSEVIREDGPLSPAHAARIGAQVAAGLVAAHARGIVHRDVKPGNILVDLDGDAKIGDFGIARMRGDDQLTRTGMVTGTPSYLAPEVARGGRPGPAADVWALGATLYAAVEGSTPYAGDGNALATLHRIVSDPPPRATHGGFLTEPISRMMDPEPASRWSMVDASHILLRLADRHPASDSGPTRTLAGVPVAGSAGAGPSADAATRTTSPAPAAAAGVPDEPPGDRLGGRRDDRQPSRRALALLAAVALVVLAGLGAWLLLRPTGADTSAGPPAPSPHPSPRHASRSPSSTPTPTPTPSPTPEPKPSQTDHGHGGGPTAGGAAMVSAVHDYFALMPGNTDAGWQRLGGSMRSVGRSNYDSFWGSITSVDTQDVKAVPGQSAVDLVLTYHFADGRVVREQQRLALARSPHVDGGYLITADTVLSSRTLSG